MPVPRERLDRWKQIRTERLASLGWVRTEDVGGKPVRFATDEILVQDTGAATAHRTLSDLGHRRSDIAEFEPAAGLRRLRTPGLDVGRAVRQLRAVLPAGAVVGANHVLLSTPHEHGGPFGPPVAAAPPGPVTVARARSRARVVVMDTGVWADSPLPERGYDAAPDAYETTLDADDNGQIDSDVGHANFIAGVVLQGTKRAQVRIVKVLDSFGVCTEAELIAAIGRLDNVDVLNLSLGGFSEDDLPPEPLAFALERFLSGTDRVVVAAAGNDGIADRPFWPAAYAGTGRPWADRVVAVAAHDGARVCEWSNTGRWVTLAAPGADVVSTYVNHADFETGWAAWSGTSFATPHVVAAIAEQVPNAGSIPAALAALRVTAKAHQFSGYPGLPVANGA
jgi:subtilisin family serine protease